MIRTTSVATPAFVGLWLASSLIGLASTPELEYFQRFTLNDGKPFVLEFRCATVSSFIPPGGLTLTNVSATGGRRLSAHVNAASTNHYLLLEDGESFVAVRSLMPLELGFHRNAEFGAEGWSSNIAWSLGPDGQLTSEPGGTGLHGGDPWASNDPKRRPFPDLDALLNYGIEAMPGSVVWQGNRFTAISRWTGRHDLVGELTVSNGVPARAWYENGTGFRTVVR